MLRRSSSLFGISDNRPSEGSAGLSLIVQANVARPSIDAKLWDARRNPKYVTLNLTGALGIYGYRDQEALNIDRNLAIALANLLLCDDRAWERLRLEYCGGHIDIVIAVALMHGAIREISFSEVILESPIIHSLSTGLKFNSSVVYLKIQSCTLDALQVSALSEGLTGNVSILSISFVKCELSDEHISVLLNALAQSPQLQRLNLEGNHCRSQAISALASLLDGSDQFLSLSLHNQHVMEENDNHLDILPLIQTLSNRHSSLRYLDLSRNSLGDDDISCFTEAFAQPASSPLLSNMTLETLHLDQNLISDNGAQIIAQALAHFGALKVLATTDNPFSSVGAEAIAAAMVTNNSLETVIIPSGLSDLQRRIRWYGNLNKGGRRIFDSVQEGHVWRLRPLFPLIFQRINKMRLSHDWNPVTAPSDVIFYALQQVGHGILSDSPPSPTGSPVEASTLAEEM